MKKRNLTNRTIILLSGVFVMALGVAISIRSGLGTTPISSVPYVYNIVFPVMSVGVLSILLNLLFVVLQILILKKEFKAFQLLQIPIVLAFGWFIDVNLAWTADFVPINYILQWIYCVAGCIIIAFGIFLQVKADIGLLPGEGLIMAIAKRLKKDFGFTKIFFDSLLVLISLISIIVFTDKIEGVREGTIVSALFVGFIVQFYQKNIAAFDKFVESSKVEAGFVSEPYMTTENYVITIARQYGSGGHAVGEAVARKLGISFYDSNLIDITAEESGFTAEYVKAHEQKLSNGLLYNLYKQNYAYVNEAIPPQDLIFMVQTKVIRDIVAKESCVIVGRCADYILKGHPNLFKVYIKANDAFRLNRVITDYDIDPEYAEKAMELKDKERENYNKHYTHRDWTAPENYDMTIESSLFGIDFTAAMVIDAQRKAMYADRPTP